MLVGIDLENMHNSVDTKRLERQVANRIPRMAELLYWFRIPGSHVYRDEHGTLHTISVSDGLDQGCPSSKTLAPMAVTEQHEELKDYGRVYGLQDDTYALADCAAVPGICDALANIFTPSGNRVKL